MFEGEERRRDYPEIKERLIKLEVLQEQDIKEALDWRVRFCNKIDKLGEMLSSLPCDKREGRWISLQAQAKWLWIAVTFIMTILTGVVLVLIMELRK
jgi:hypothetical protein